jgi:DNA-binding LacI/PurR family transcriptional regulator
MERKRATIADVAAHAGVSKATVSGVLNGTAAVRADTRARVLAAAERLAYQLPPRPQAPTPDASASGDPAPHPAAGRGVARPDATPSLGVVVREGCNPFYAEVIDGVRAVADARGYAVLVASSEGDYGAERRAVELLHAKEVGGLMAYPILDDDSDLSHFFELRRRNYPVVLLEGVRGLPACLVDIDNRAASAAAVEHLVALGHTRIAHFAGPRYSLHGRERADGVRQACSNAQVRFTEAQLVPAGASLEDGRRAALAYFRGCAPGERPTGVTCYNDLVAVGVYRALTELGLRVPDDVSLVGFDDIALARYLPVQLTTVSLPKAEIGRLAAELLIAQVGAAPPPRAQRHFLDAPLVVRASTRAPAAGR